jgi:DeoR family deoxyribose operon repressor
MNSANNNVYERIEAELNIISSRHFITIGQLAQDLGVSEMTIRRDLRSLADKNTVKLVYGGVIPVQDDQGQNSYNLTREQDKNIAQKLAIVKQAIRFLKPTDVVFLDSGTTVQLFAEQMPQEYSNTAICASLNTLNILVKLPSCTVICPGGVYAPKPVVFYNPDSTKLIRKYRANKAFIGATGYELTLGLTCSYVEDAPLKQAMMESSQDKILLSDSAKFGRVSTCVFGKIEDFTMVITDSGIPDEYARHIREAGVELVIV